MHNTQKITNDLYYLGVNDRRIELFENIFPVHRGVSYNSYLLKDEKTVLIDTVDRCALSQFVENLKYELNGRDLDYIVVNHMEPDHTATLQEIVERYPNAKIVSNQKAITMMKQFFDYNFDSRSQVIKEGDILETGKHKLTFVMAPMVHWPEAMVTFDLTDGILFSADAFGTFGALNGNIFADEVNFEKEWLSDARRYYTNIVGKYGTQVQALLKKAETLDIKMICPLHGPIWRNKIGWYVEKYKKWSTCEPEEQTVLILYGSIYGHTANAAQIIASKLADKGIKNIKVYDVSKTHSSHLIAEAFRCSHIVIASATYNAGIFCNMETILTSLKAHDLKNRKVAIIENGTWAPTACSLIKKFMDEMKGMEIVEPVISIKSSLKNEQLKDIDQLVENIAKTISIRPSITDPLMDISYGLYVISTKDEKDNGCIINTVNQVSNDPKSITVSVNKANYTCDIIKKTGKFTISVLTEETPFSVFERFGFTSGRETDKMSDCTYLERESNGLLGLNKYVNTVINAKVTAMQDLGSHMLFIAEVEDTKTISNVPSATYEYYLTHIKPVIRKEEGKKGFVCKICGYVYEGETLPPDFICPLCKHGVEDFEPLK